MNIDPQDILVPVTSEPESLAGRSILAKQVRIMEQIRFSVEANDIDAVLFLSDCLRALRGLRTSVQSAKTN